MNALKLLLFAFFDQKAEAYMTPFCLATQAMALRAFKDAVGNEESSLHRHPEDYYLFQLAEIDMQTGEVVVKNVALGNGVRFAQSVRDIEFPSTEVANAEK